MLKTISSITNLVRTTMDQGTAIVTHLGSAAVHGSKALDLLAEDLESAVISSTKINALERRFEHEKEMARFALPE